jgi:hypothetical protein
MVVAAVLQYSLITVTVGAFIWFYPPVALFLILLLPLLFAPRSISIKTRSIVLGVVAIIVALYPIIGANAPKLFAIGIPVITVAYSLSALIGWSQHPVVRSLYIGVLVAYCSTALIAPYIVMFYLRIHPEVDSGIAQQLHLDMSVILMIILTLVFPMMAIAGDYARTTMRSSGCDGGAGSAEPGAPRRRTA